MSTSFIIMLVLAWCLANLIITLLFITSTGEAIALETLPSVFAAMIFNIIPVFIIIQLMKRRKSARRAQKGKR